MVPFLPSFIAFVSALVFPALAGLMIVAVAARYVHSRYLAAFALGIFLWFFSDTIADSSYLDVNSGFGGGGAQLLLVLLFAAGLVLVFTLDRTAFRGSAEAPGLGFGIPLLLAFAIGVHGVGEGAAFSATAATTPATDLLDAFGGLSPAVAFVLHKILEPVMIGAAYWVYARGHARDAYGFVKDTLLLVLVFVIPGVVGAATDYSASYETTYFFALGLGTSTYALVRLSKPLFGESGSKWDAIKVALLVLFGFLSIYFAALFHS